MAGRAAEEILLDGEHTQGAAGDLQAATHLAQAMVTQYGMTDFGYAQLDAETLRVGGEVAVLAHREIDEPDPVGARTRHRRCSTDHRDLLERPRRGAARRGDARRRRASATSRPSTASSGRPAPPCHARRPATASPDVGVLDMLGMRRPRVVVVGSVNVDLVVRLPRLPVAGETAGGGVFSQGPGGKGGNQAVAAARLGADVLLVAALGGDDHGRQARADLEREGIDIALVGTADAATGVAVVLVDDTAENLIAVAPGANAALAPDAVTAALTGLPGGPAVVLACLEVPLACVEAAAVVAADRGWPLVLNPAPAPSSPLPPALLRRTAVLTPNEGELAVLAPQGPGPLLDAGVGAVVVTCGAAGAVIHDASGEHVVPAPPIRAVDTTGAGDCLSGALACALGSGLALPDAVRLAVTAASVSTTAAGARTGYPRPAELT